jgi:transposase-like protein
MIEEGQLEGGSKVVKCPNCGSENVEPVEMFDYYKQCKDCGKEFTTGIHN